MFQDNLLLSYLSAQSNIEAALLAGGVGRRERRQRALSCWPRSVLRERHGMTVLVISHDAAVAERADHVVHLVDGQVASPP